MKKIATILMLVAALLCSTATMDAKTTKKASKTKTTQIKRSPNVMGKATKTAQYDNLVSQYVTIINNLEKAGRNAQWDKVSALGEKHIKLRAKINTVRKALSPAQLSKVKKAEKKYDSLLNGVIAG